MSEPLNHFNTQGEAHMVDVGDKIESDRRAVAEGHIQMKPETLQRILEGSSKKGDVLAIARIAGIMAAKKTPELIPLCHPIALTHVNIEFQLDETNSSVLCKAEVKTFGATGAEMEALMAVHVSLLTVYDMCKAMDRGMAVTDIHLLSKSGGKSGDWRRKV